jgi:hypothetical protein
VEDGSTLLQELAGGFRLDRLGEEISLAEVAA